MFSILTTLVNERTVMASCVGMWETFMSQRMKHLASKKSQKKKGIEKASSKSFGSDYLEMRAQRTGHHHL